MATHIEAVIVDALLSEAASVSLPTGFEKAWPNTAFDPLDNSTGYVRFSILKNTPTNPRIRFGDEPIRRGILQASVFVPENRGIVSASETVGIIRDAFARGTKITSGSVTIRIDDEPDVGPDIQNGAWVQIPVSIPYIVYP